MRDRIQSQITHVTFQVKWIIRRGRGPNHASHLKIRRSTISLTPITHFFQQRKSLTERKYPKPCSGAELAPNCHPRGTASTMSSESARGDRTRFARAYQ